MFDRHLRTASRRWPAAPALIRPDCTLSFSDLDAVVDRAAELCRELDARPGEAVAVAVDDPVLQVIAGLALARLGIAAAPGDDPIWPLRVTDGAGPGRAVRLTAALLSAGSRLTSAPRTPDPDALGRVVMSSGTTGLRKRMGLSWRALEARIANASEAYGVSGGPWLSGTGMHTTFGFNIMLAAWTRGEAILLAPGGAFEIDHVLQCRPRLLSCIPMQLKLLVDNTAQDTRSSPMRVVVAAGAIPAALGRRARLAISEDVLNVYGVAETGGIAVAGLEDVESLPGVAGRLLPSTAVEIVDDSDERVPSGTVGHLRVSTDRLAAGYIDDNRTRTPIARDGWFYPGDVGRLEGARLIVDGRKDDLMNIAGHKVLPLWVEHLALACPGIEDAGAFSRPDADGLERCVLAVVTCQELDISGLRQALAPVLRWIAAIDVLRVDALPRNAAGKIDRGRLKAGLARASSQRV